MIFNKAKKIAPLLLIISSGLFFLFLTNNIKKSEANESNQFAINHENYNKILKIYNSKNQLKANFKVAIANNYNLRTNGLMFVKSLPDNFGMLFIFEKESIIKMWMKNTFINLDMLFIDNDNKIIKIEKDVKKLSEKIISSDFKASKVLEINANLTNNFDIKVGDFIKY